jgi:predicted enzyme related to lactoylglutathione lyase
MTNEVGKIGWIDMTVENAAEMRDFYANVVGLKTADVSMGDYTDYNMTMPATGEPVAGICHARGSNADFPPSWLIYFVVENAEKSALTCVDNGGSIVVPVRGLAGGQFCVIKDPNAAVAALYQPQV